MSEPILDPELLTVVCLGCETIQQLEEPRKQCDMCAGTVCVLQYDVGHLFAKALLDLHAQLDTATEVLSILYDVVPDEVAEAVEIVQTDQGWGTDDDLDLEFHAAFQWGAVGEA